MKGEKKHKSEFKNKERNTEGKCNKHKTKRGEAQEREGETTN
jgi:hypothetical protein